MYICPVCGCNKLEEEPYDVDGNPSYEICKCCGFEFGCDEDIVEYRRNWLNKGAEWFIAKEKPEGWNLKLQLKNINYNI